MKKIILVLIMLLSFNLNPLYTQEYSFYKINDSGLIKDVVFHNDEIYLLGLHFRSNSIQTFDKVNQSFKDLYSKDQLKEKGITDIKDFVFFKNDLFVLSDNKLINISNNFAEYVFDDEYNHKPMADNYRQLHNLIVRDNSLLIGSTSAKVISRDTLDGTPFAHIDPFNELLKYENGKIERVLDERNSNFKFEFNYSPVIDKQNNLWFRESQSSPLKGGLLKINQNNEIEKYDIKSYSGIGYLLQPSSIDVIDNLLYLGFSPRSESGYLEGLCIYNKDNNEFTYTIDYLKNNDIYKGYSWETPKKIKKLENGTIAILGSEFTIQNGDSYLYYDITKSQELKGYFQDYSDNLDIIETNEKYFVVRESGILVFDKSSITGVNKQLRKKYEFRTTNNSIEFKSDINSYKVYDLLGKVIKIGFSGNNIDISNFITGPYFILLNEEYIIKFVKQ